jgi:FMN phosphatase YigB (HAD superfamily)
MMRALLILLLIGKTSFVIAECHHIPPRNSIKCIIWDAGSTLTTVGRLQIAQEMGAKTIMQMLWYLGSKYNIQKTIFEVLEDYAGRQIAPSYELLSYDKNQLVLPRLMSETWFCSRISNDELMKEIDKAVDQWNPGRPVSKKERVMLKRVLKTALSAKILGKHTRCAPEALELVRTFHLQGFRQYILSNFEKEAFEIAYANPVNKELFSYIPREHIVISGDCKMIKPHRCIYEYFLSRYDLKPEECLLIDDRWENVNMARECGMYAITLKNENYKQLNVILKKWHVL